MTNLTPIQIQLKIEEDMINSKRVDMTDRWNNTKVTDKQSVKSIGLLQKVKSIGEKITEVKEVKNGLRTRKVSQLDLIKGGHTGKSLGTDIVNFLTTGDDLQVKVNTFVQITLTEMFDGSFSVRENRDIHPELSDKSLLILISENIGEKIETFLRMKFLKESDKDLYNKVFYSHLTDQVLGNDYHIQKLIKGLSDIGDSWTVWTVEQKIRIGRIFVGLILNNYYDSEEVSPFFLSIEVVNSQKYTYVLPVQDLQDKVNDDFQQLSNNLLVREPMLIEPVKWSNGVHGGYYTNSLIKKDSVVRGHQLERSQPSEQVFDFINNLQSITYKVNPFTVEVMNTLNEMGVEIGKFIPKSSISNRVKKDGTNWKVSPHTVRYSQRTEKTVDVVTRWKDIPEFYIPWSFDFRGRVYPLTSYMSPQGTDFDKSLLMFSKGETLTEDGLRWLKIHISTTYGKDGLDKKSLTERIEWVDNNIDLIERVSSDPIGNLDLWKDSEEPWCFLSSCREYVDVVLNGQPTHLMVASDATCSGLQILSGLSLDRNSGKLVNVVPSPTLQDAYLSVWKSAKDKLIKEGMSEELITELDKFGRTLSKKVVMTVPYNASLDTNYKQIREVLKEKKVSLDKDQLKTLVKSIGQHGMETVVPGPMKVRKWFNDSVSNYFKQDPQPTNITWVTPSGFRVVQENFVPDTIEIDGLLIGKNGKQGSKMTVTVGWSSETNTRGHRTSFSPNLIHSLDASLLHLTFSGVDYDFSVIHDSILTNPNHMGESIEGLKKTYSSMFEGRKYLNYIKDEVLCSPLPLPEFEETFDSSEVMGSEFFFS